jgi:hypothetical protein
MKKTTLFILFLLFLFCNRPFYTNNKFFDCKPNSNFVADTDKKILITKILNRAVIEQKDVPSYDLIEDKTKIYISEIYYPDFWNSKEKLVLKKSEIPIQIGNVRFCIKSEAELQKIADQTSDFLYLNLIDIRIEGDTATVGLTLFWQSQTDSKIVYLSGGGLICQYIKVNREWIYDKNLRHWML